MKTVAINGTWPLSLPDNRAAWHQSLPAWEATRLASMHEHLSAGDLIVDVGAEFGDFTSLYGTWGCEVVAVEPAAHYWPSIRRTWAENVGRPIAGCFVGFASDVDEFTPPFLAHEDPYPTAGWPKCSEGPIDKRDGFAHLAQQHNAIPQCTLDRLARQFGMPDALTLDCEGSDYRVLCGARTILSEAKPRVWVSVHSDQAWMDQFYDGRGLDAITNLLGEYGYAGELLEESHEAHWRFWYDA